MNIKTEYLMVSDKTTSRKKTSDKDNLTKAFTLLEVLIAITVVAVSITGIFSLHSKSLNLSFFAGEKIHLINSGFEYILIKERYPQSGFFNRTDAKDIEYSSQKTADIYGILSEYTLTAKGKEAEINFRYFIKQ